MIMALTSSHQSGLFDNKTMTVVPSNVHSNETSVASRLRKPTNNCPGYTVQGTLSRVHCPGYTVLGTLSRVHCPGYTVLGTLSWVHCPGS